MRDTDENVPVELRVFRLLATIICIVIVCLVLTSCCYSSDIQVYGDYGNESYIDEHYVDKQEVYDY